MALSPDLQDTLIKTINELLTLIIAGVSSYLLVLFRSWAKAKIAEAKAKISQIEDSNLRDSINDALIRLDKTSETVVAELENTIKKYTAEGKVIDPEKLKAFAHGRIKNRLMPGARSVLIKQVGEVKLDRIIQSKIEQKALDIKIGIKTLRQARGINLKEC